MRTIFACVLVLSGCSLDRFEGLGQRLSDRALDRVFTEFVPTALHGAADRLQEQGQDRVSRDLEKAAVEWEQLGDDVSQETISEPQPPAIVANPRARCLCFTMPGCRSCPTYFGKMETSLTAAGWKWGQDCDADFQLVDVCAHEAFAEQYDIDRTPTLVIIAPDGQELARAGLEMQGGWGDWLNRHRAAREKPAAIVKPPLTPQVIQRRRWR